MDNNQNNNNYKRLVRSKTNRSISGVCGGIGEYLGVDPVIFRLAWVILTICTVGMGVLGYIIAALIIPEQMD
ncbi:MAG: PspC domain-containing protein [Lachnospiraceae bacterium]|nr:PspC domain-containing protein [Lachnospiraceae bacterium]